MTLRKALPTDLEMVIDIVHTTVSAIYPHYYPQGAVDYFLAYHNREVTLADIQKGCVWVCCSGERIVGTVTIRGNEILRLFVLPQDQGNGYGMALLHLAEQEAARHSDEIVIDASLTAKGLYEKRGYKEVGFHAIPAGEDFLCYDHMVKPVSDDLS